MTPPRPRLLFLGLLLAAFTWASDVAVAEDGARLDADAIVARVREHLTHELRAASPDADVEVRVGSLDSRLAFPACESLHLTTQGGPVGRVSVTVRCSGPRAWSAVVPATSSVYAPVVVVTRPVPRGVLISPSDVAIERRDLADVRGGYLTELDAASDWIAKRDLAPGTVLSTRQLEMPLAVARGDEVEIVAMAGAVRVHATGTALGAGLQGDQISVRNAASRRVVRARIVGPGRVATGAPGEID